MTQIELDILKLRTDVADLRVTLGTLIAWMGQSAGSLLSRGETEHLLRTLTNVEPTKERG